MNLASTEHDNDAGMVESALNRMEATGYRRVAIEQAAEEGTGLYIFHSDQ